MHIPQLCRNKWPTLPLGVVRFKLKPGLIRAFDGLRVNVCPLNTNHLFFTLWPSVLTARPVWWGWDNLSITAPCPAWERPAEDVLTIVKLGEMSPAQKHLDGGPVSHLDLLWGLSSWGGGERLVGRWPWWPASLGTWLAKFGLCAPGEGHGWRMDPCTCACVGNTARIIVPVL